MRLGPKALVGLGLPAALTRNKGVGVPSGFSLWKTDTQTWRIGVQRIISPART